MTRIWNEHKLNTPPKRKVFVGMSGGVDSSVAALLLKERGYDVVGVFIKSWDGLPTEDGVKFRDQCRWREDRRDALRVAAKLKLPFLTYDFTAAYRERIIESFFAEYAVGRTPNPDVLCNREIKFKLFLEHALAVGADGIATGHYARVRRAGERYELSVAADATKDQSYFLHTLGQRELAHSLFPVGDLTKVEVRAMARRSGLPTAEKKDSQGICFVGEVPVIDFLRARIPERVGLVVTTDGRVVGEHRGVAFYTLGQRHGLRVSADLPYYVAAKDVATNTLVVGRGNSDPVLYQQTVDATNATWVASPPVVGDRLGAKVRYRQPTQAVTVARRSDNRWRFVFDEPQRSVTPGQSIVLYDSERVVGGAVISG